MSMLNRDAQVGFLEAQIEKKATMIGRFSDVIQINATIQQVMVVKDIQSH